MDVAGEGSLMRRFSIILTFALVCLAGATFVPGAAAGNFDGDKMGCSGESPTVCPTATVGQPYSLTIYLIHQPLLMAILFALGLIRF